MIKTPAYAAASATSPLLPFTIERRKPGAHEVLIDILYCGVCHSDIHQARDEWGGSIYPMVPGHEIIGAVQQTGTEVSRWKVGDIVGVGCFVDSCRECEAGRAKNNIATKSQTLPITAGNATAKRRPTAAIQRVLPSTNPMC